MTRPRAWTPSRRAVPIALLACAIGTGSSSPRAFAQAAAHVPAGPEPAGWSSLHVPGGTSALLAAAGLDPARPRTTALLDIIRVVHELPEGVDRAADERRLRLVGYLDAVAEFERARRALQPPVALALADAKDTRRRLEELARVLGSSLEREHRTYRMRLGAPERARQRREWLRAAGLDVVALEATLNSGRAVTLTLDGDEVPLPLPESAWRALLAGRDMFTEGAALATSILRDRKASLLYHGLTAMDAETRRYLAASPALLGEIYESGRAATLALYGRSLHVRDGRVITPGPEAASALWEALAGERVTSPDRFILEVLGKDNGRLALIYDAVAHVDAPRQAFALGLWLADAERRTDRFKAFYAACAPALAGWDPTVRPFIRVLYDPVQWLVLTRVMPDGRPAPPAWARLWAEILGGDGLPGHPADDLDDVEQDGLADAARLVETILVAGHAVRRDRAEAWLFAQRVFGDVPVARMPEVFVAMRGAGRFRILADTLARLDVTDPAVHVSAFSQAQRLAGIGDRERAATALALYQGALVLVERARLGRAIDATTAARLVGSLSRVPVSDDGEYLGGIATWIDLEYLPAIGRVVGSPVGDVDNPVMEGDVLGAFAGRRADSAGHADRTFEYEGILYRVDPAAPERARLQAVRAQQGGASLDAAMGFAREVLAIAAGVADVSTLPAHVASLEVATRRLLASLNGGQTGDGEAHHDLAEALDEATRALRKIRAAKDLGKIERIAMPLRRRVDRHLGQVLTSLAYASSLGDPGNSALLAGDPSRRHDWGLATRDAGVRARAPWAMPAQGRDAGGRWHVSGSLLALDVGLGDLALRRTSSDALPEAPTITGNDRQALTEAVVLANAFDYRDADMALIAEALARGRARVAALASAPELLPGVIADASLDETRQQLLAWTLVHEPGQVAAWFSLGDVLSLGQAPGGATAALEAWGTSSLSFDGCLCLRLPASGQWATLSGRRGKGLLATLVPDVALLVAETLHEQRLPAALARPVLAVATLEVIERVQLAHDDDWMAMTSGIQRYLPARMDDYLASVITGGQLIPVSKDPDGARVP